MPDPTLLVIEDAREHAILVRVAARRAVPGLDVRVAGDGREGIAYMAGTPPFQDRRSHPTPALIILDLIMPEIDGYAVLEWLREHRAAERVPVVVLTASPDPAAEERSMTLGSTAFYRKPDNLDQLGVVVKEIVEVYLGEALIAGVMGSAL
ncbi:MAG: response regulator [Gemmatimonadota bacterium]|nr:response regulator [Gemmatimonadota bacterium]MDH3422199.1 response regulator [Gemmatimonadota bacterium]